MAKTSSPQSIMPIDWRDFVQNGIPGNMGGKATPSGYTSNKPAGSGATQATPPTQGTGIAKPKYTYQSIPTGGTAAQGNKSGKGVQGTPGSVDVLEFGNEKVISGMPVFNQAIRNMLSQMFASVFANAAQSAGGSSGMFNAWLPQAQQSLGMPNASVGASPMSAGYDKSIGASFASGGIGEAAALMALLQGGAQLGQSMFGNTEAPQQPAQVDQGSPFVPALQGPNSLETFMQMLQMFGPGSSVGASPMSSGTMGGDVQYGVPADPQRLQMAERMGQIGGGAGSMEARSASQQGVPWYFRTSSPNAWYGTGGPPPMPAPGGAASTSLPPATSAQGAPNEGMSRYTGPMMNAQSGPAVQPGVGGGNWQGPGPNMGGLDPSMMSLFMQTGNIMQGGMNPLMPGSLPVNGSMPRGGSFDPSAFGMGGGSQGGAVQSPLQEIASAFSLPSYGGQMTAGPTPLQRQSTDFASQFLNSNPFGDQANIQNMLNQMIGGQRFDNSPEFAALEQMTNRRMDEQSAQLNEQFGMSGLRASSDLARGQGQMRGELLAQEALQRAQIARESFENSQNRRLGAGQLSQGMGQGYVNNLATLFGMGESDRQAQERGISRQMAEFARTQGALFPLLMQFALTGTEGDSLILEPEDE